MGGDYSFWDMLKDTFGGDSGKVGNRTTSSHGSSDGYGYEGNSHNSRGRENPGQGSEPDYDSGDSFWHT